MVTIKRISVGSAFKVSAVVTAFMWVIITGLLMAFPTALLGSSGIHVMTLDGGGNVVDLGGEGSLTLSLLVVLCGVPFGAIFGGLIGAFYAFAYNIVSGWVGGIEVELSGPLFNRMKNDWGEISPTSPYTDDGSFR